MADNKPKRHARKRKEIVLAVAAFMVLFGAYAFGYAQGQNDPTQHGSPSTTAAEFTEPSLLDLINLVRAKGGKPALTEDPQLDQAAQARTTFAINQGIWNHVGANGEQWYTTDEQYAPMHRYYGENLGRCYSSNAATVDAWVHSPKHYEIMMGNYSKVGFNTVFETKTMTDTYAQPPITFSNCYVTAAEFSS